MWDCCMSQCMSPPSLKPTMYQHAPIWPRLEAKSATTRANTQVMIPMLRHVLEESSKPGLGQSCTPCVGNVWAPSYMVSSVALHKFCCTSRLMQTYQFKICCNIPIAHTHINDISQAIPLLDHQYPQVTSWISVWPLVKVNILTTWELWIVYYLALKLYWSTDILNTHTF